MLRRLKSIFYKLKNIILIKEVKIGYRCELNKKTKFSGFNRIGKLCNINSSEIGEFSYIGDNCILQGVKLGKFSSLGSRINVISGIHPKNIFVSTHPVFYSLRKQCGVTFVNEQLFNENNLLEEKYKVIIGSDVWIGDNVSIFEGVKIGNGAIIGANTLVTKDIDDYSINIGSPSKCISYRFNEKEISNLNVYRWWDKDISWIKENVNIFLNISEFNKVFFKKEEKDI